MVPPPPPPHTHAPEERWETGPGRCIPTSTYVDQAPCPPWQHTLNQHTDNITEGTKWMSETWNLHGIYCSVIHVDSTVYPSDHYGTTHFSPSRRVQPTVLEGGIGSCQLGLFTYLTYVHTSVELAWGTSYLAGRPGVLPL